MENWNLVPNFEKSKATDLILSLLDNGSMNFTELMKTTKSNPRTLSDRIRDLSNAKLITVSKKKQFPFTETIKLTYKGEEIAQRMKRVYSHSDKGISKRALKLLYVMHEAGGKIVGTTRMEKLPFLLEKEYGIKFDYHYYSMTYGPYSVELLDDIKLLERNGFLNVNEEFVPVKTTDGSIKETERRTYILTEKGVEKCKKQDEKILPIDEDSLKFIHDYNNFTLKSLLDYVHSKYPKYKKESKDKN